MSEKRFVACDKWADSEGNIFRFVVIDTKVLGDKQFILRCNHWIEAQDICNKLNDTLDELREENEQLREINKELGDDLYNCRLNKNIIREKLKLWQDVHKEYGIYSIKDFEESFELDAKINKEKGI